MGKRKSSSSKVSVSTSNKQAKTMRVSRSQSSGSPSLVVTDEQQRLEVLNEGDETAQSCSTLNKEDVSHIVSEVMKALRNGNPRCDDDSVSSGLGPTVSESGELLPGMSSQCVICIVVFISLYYGGPKHFS